MEEIFFKDEEEIKKEKEFSKKFVSPYFREFYLYRYQVLRVMKFTPKQARNETMSELNIIWEKIGEELADEEQEL